MCSFGVGNRVVLDKNRVEIWDICGNHDVGGGVSLEDGAVTGPI